MVSGKIAPSFKQTSLVFVLCAVHLPFGSCAWAEAPSLPYRNACGPIAVFVSLYAIGEDPDLQDLARACHWQFGKKTSVAQIVECLEMVNGVKATPVQLNVKDLAEFIGDGGTAIVPVRRDRRTEIDHAISVIGLSDDGCFVISDYPQIVGKVAAADLENLWDSSAILIQHRWTHWIWENVFALVLPTIMFCLGVVRYGWRIAPLSDES